MRNYWPDGRASQWRSAASSSWRGARRRTWLTTTARAGPWPGRNAGSCGSTSAPRPASARPTPCSARGTGGPNAAPTWWWGSSRRTGGRTPRAAGRPGGASPGARWSTAGATFEEMDLDAVLARHPQIALVDEFAHTNVPGSRQREALAGRRGTARRRDRRDLRGQHPAPGIPQRRGREDHRRAAAGDRARRDRPRGRPGRAGRHDAGGAAPPDGARQHLPAGEDRRGADQLLPLRATSPRCASSPCSGWPTRWTRACSATAPSTTSRAPGRPGSGWWSR